MNIIDFKNEESLPYEVYWKSAKAPNYGLTHLIQLMGSNIIYVETGVGKGVGLSAILQRCKNIKIAYGVDFYRENTDYFDRTPHTYSDNDMSFWYQRARHRILSSGMKDKVKIIKEHTSLAVNYFEDNSIDILFLDNYLSEEDVYNECKRWYNKVKINGYFAGHDWPYDGVQNSVHKFRNENNITSPLSAWGGEWVWKKKENI